MNSITIIGGADGPTTIYMFGSNIVLSIVLLVIFIFLSAFFVFRFVKNIKSGKKLRTIIDGIGIALSLFIMVYSLLTFLNAQTAIKKNTDKVLVESKVTGFYDVINQLNDEYYSTNIFDDFQISEELKNNFEHIFADKSIYENIVNELLPLGYQQPDNFLFSIRNAQIEDIHISNKKKKEITVIAKVETNHWFYDLGDFRFYNNIGITADELHEMQKQSMIEYQEIGQGKYGGLEMKSKETHIFHLVKINNEYKIHDFEFNIDSCEALQSK